MQALGESASRATLMGTESQIAIIEQPGCDKKISSKSLEVSFFLACRGGEREMREWRTNMSVIFTDN